MEFAGMGKTDRVCVAGTLSPWQSRESVDVATPETFDDLVEKPERCSTCEYPCEPFMMTTASGKKEREK